MKEFVVDHMKVLALNRRLAVKYYRQCYSREPEQVEDVSTGQIYNVVAFCENTDKGIFEDDVQNVDYGFDSEGVYWLLKDEEYCDLEYVVTSFLNFIRKEVGDTADWPIHFKCDDDHIANQLAEHLNALEKAVKQAKEK